MNPNTEIEELKAALAASPDNAYLRKLLVKKMAVLPDYQAELEQLLQAGIKARPGAVFLRAQLGQLYFRQQKISACIVVLEALREEGQLESEDQLILAKAYYQEGNLAAAQDLYQYIISLNPQLSDTELDDAFRQKSQPAADDYEDLIGFKKPDINFTDVGGMEGVKREIELKIIKPLEHAELFASYGKKVGGGILLYGPPGCGKTFIAKATAGQIDANFINISLNDVLDMWIGNSEKNLHNYFETARAHQPCVVFIDEIDALGAKRSDLRTSGGKNIINQFLAELDGIESNNEGLLIIGATNVPWHLDPAFRRPGRFDRIIFVPPPDEAGRESILRLKLADKPTENIDYRQLARKTKDFSGADLNAIIDIAIEAVLEAAIQTGTPKPLTTKMLLAAAKKHRPTTTDWFTTAKNYAMFANKSGLYDDILKYLK